MIDYVKSLRQVQEYTQCIAGRPCTTFKTRLDVLQCQYWEWLLTVWNTTNTYQVDMKKKTKATLVLIVKIEKLNTRCFAKLEGYTYIRSLLPPLKHL